MQWLNLSKTKLPHSLTDLLRTINRRLRWQAGLRLLPQVLSTGLLGTLLLILLGRFYPLALPPILLGLGLIVTLTGLLGVLAYVWLRPRPPLAVARLLDHRLNLDERLATSLELAANTSDTPTPIIEAQLADTLYQLKDFEPSRSFPTRWPWRWFAVIAALVIAIAVGMIVPNPQVQALHQRAKNEEIIEKQKAQFEEIRAELLEEETLLETPDGQELLQTLDELIDTLEQSNLTPEEALAAISEAEQELATLQDAAGQQEATLNDLAQTFSQFDSTADLAKALEQRQLAQAAEALASAGNDLAANPESAQELAEALRQAAQSARQNGNSELAEELAEAAEALEQAAGQGGDPQAAQEALEQAAQALAEAGEQLANQEAVERALGNIQEAREQLAEGSGQGQQPGRGGSVAQGEGGTMGGSGREDPGPGAEGLAAEEGAPDQMSTDNGPNEGRTGDYAPLYAPSHLGGEGGPLVKPDPQGAQEGVPIGDAPVDPNRDPGAAQVPYNQIYGQYNDAAGQALEDSYIPLGMKGYIRQYFGALEPEGE